MQVGRAVAIGRQAYVAVAGVIVVLGQRPVGVDPVEQLAGRGADLLGVCMPGLLNQDFFDELPIDVFDRVWDADDGVGDDRGVRG